MNLENEFIPYEQALNLKELGFDEPCFGYFDPLLGDYTIMNSDCINPKPTLFNHNPSSIVVSAPTFSQVFRWFREKYNLVCIMTFDDDVKGKWFGNLYGHYETHGKYDFGYTELFKTYEEAELECLTKLIEICKK